MAEQKFTSMGASAADLDLAWKDRLKDAEAMLKAKRPAAAIASGIYALEIRLKTMICGKLELKRLPRAFEIHDLDGLLLLAGLHARLLEQSSTMLLDNWNAVKKMAAQINELRYTPNRRWKLSQAETLLRQLQGPHDGVMVWLSMH